MSFSPSCHQLFSLRACLPPGRARRAPRRSTTEAPRRRTKRRASTTPQWTGGSSCVTRGTWSRPSGQWDSPIQLQGSCSGTGLLLLSQLFCLLPICRPISLVLIPLPFLCPQAYLLDRTQDWPSRCGLHSAKTGLPSRQDYNSQVASEGRDGPPGQGAFCSHQETRHGSAGRKGEERQRQRRTLRNMAAAAMNAEFTVLLRLLYQEPLRHVTCEAQLSLPLWETPLSALTQAFCTVFIPCKFGIVSVTWLLEWNLPLVPVVNHFTEFPWNFFIWIFHEKWFLKPLPFLCFPWNTW